MRIMAMAVLAAAGIAGGCAGPIAARNEDLVQYPQVQLDAYSLHEAIVVQQPRVNRVGAGQLHVAITVRNRWDRDLHLQYKGYFVDQGGMTVEQPGPWTDFTVPRKGIDGFEFTSLGPTAADFRVEIREAH
jgi:uncharacterized protein YcfL